MTSNDSHDSSTATAGHAHGAEHGSDQGHHGHDEHGISHVAAMPVLLITWLALMFLTVVTVLATKVDFGPSLNLALAMFIAGVKATLVVLYFMHLRYDRVFHSVIFVGSLLAAALFVGFALMDSHQYKPSLVWDKHAPPAAPDGPRLTPQK